MLLDLNFGDLPLRREATPLLSLAFSHLLTKEQKVRESLLPLSIICTVLCRTVYYYSIDRSKQEGSKDEAGSDDFDYALQYFSVL